MSLYDAHNHLQDERLLPFRNEILADLRSLPIARMVVNGTSETDWPSVSQLAQTVPAIIPSYGLHPWFVTNSSTDWQNTLIRYLDQSPSAVGEIGLDRWIPKPDLPRQEAAFIWQWHLAVDRNLPMSIHCLRAWGRMLELVQSLPRSPRGFLLHSYGGPAELIEPFAKLGAYFSISGYFAHEKKARQQSVFQQIPPDRFLVETDAPDMTPPQSMIQFPLLDSRSPNKSGLNHPANLEKIYEFAARVSGEPIEPFARRIEQNFRELFL